jgi:hypothetical protein
MATQNIQMTFTYDDTVWTVPRIDAALKNFDPNWTTQTETRQACVKRMFKATWLDYDEAARQPPPAVESGAGMDIT